MAIIRQDHIITPSNPSPNSSKLYPKSDGYYYSLDSSGVERRLNENRVNSLNAHIETPSNKTFSLVFNATSPGTINEIYYQLAAGTCTLDIKINAVAVTGLATLAANTSKNTAVATGTNTYIAGDEITLTMSSVSAATDLKLTIKTTDA